MITNFLKRYSQSNKKREIVLTLIKNLNINEKQKELYLSSVDVLDETWLEKLYQTLTLFSESYELKEIEDIKKENFSSIAWMRKKEVLEKQKELNSFWFLLNNL